MFFRFKIQSIANPTEIVDDTAVAKDEGQLRALYQQMGFNVVEISEAKEDPGLPPQPQDMQPDLAGLRQLGISDEPIPQAPPQPMSIEFSDNGIDYKVEGGVIYKRDWIICDSDEYCVVNNDGEKIDDVNVMRLDWIKIKDEEEETE